MFPILAGYIAMALADRPALMPGIVGGLLAKSGMTMAAEEAGWVSSGFFGALIAGFAAGLSMLFIENSGKASKSAGGNKADAFVSVFGNRGNGSPYGICGQSAGRSVQ